MDRVEEFVMSGTRVGSYSMNTENMPTAKQLYINLEPKDGLLEIPDFFLRFFMNVIKDFDAAVYNLYAVGGAITRKMIKGALSDFMKAAILRRLTMVHMASGDSYYGLPGVIMDSDFHILMMTTFNVRVHDVNHRSGFTILNHNCRISPRVFLRADKNIEKMIIKKVVPFCASHIVTVHEDVPSLPNPEMFAIKEGTSIRVIIEDIDQYFIHTAVSPKISDDTTKIASDILKANVSNILL